MWFYSPPAVPRAPTALHAAAAALRLPLRTPPYLTSTHTSGAPRSAKCAATAASVLAVLDSVWIGRVG